MERTLTGIVASRTTRPSTSGPPGTTTTTVWRDFQRHAYFVCNSCLRRWKIIRATLLLLWLWLIPSLPFGFWLAGQLFQPNAFGGLGMDAFNLGIFHWIATSTVALVFLWAYARRNITARLKKMAVIERQGTELQREAWDVKREALPTLAVKVGTYQAFTEKEYNALRSKQPY
jgi:hypothetical protein